ncbi:hypothetical protein ATCCBAA256_12610 [Mycobacterium montefiorense]|nr:hypothetical protein ATCCBAA256_12610 [Mycobacterium montefiorense]
MSTAPYREFETVFTREPDSGGDVSAVHASRHRGWVPVNRVVPNTPCASVFTMLWINNLARQQSI